MISNEVFEWCVDDDMCLSIIILFLAFGAVIPRCLIWPYYPRRFVAIYETKCKAEPTVSSHTVAESASFPLLACLSNHRIAC